MPARPHPIVLRLWLLPNVALVLRDGSERDGWIAIRWNFAFFVAFFSAFKCPSETNGFFMLFCITFFLCRGFDLGSAFWLHIHWFIHGYVLPTIFLWVPLFVDQFFCFVVESMWTLMATVTVTASLHVTFDFLLCCYCCTIGASLLRLLLSTDFSRFSFPCSCLPLLIRARPPK